IDQQKLASQAISKHMFKSTLIHELGHNLGLRHNFMGSTDETHFYTEAELAQSKIGHLDKPAAYSSIMDYGASIFDELLTFGKYDKAALR
ncbi:zinc-dependent metalloprotease, partial [Vibrio sp. 10N.286.49.E1]